MLRKTIVVLLALLLTLGGAAAQSDDQAKRIPHQPYVSVTGNPVYWYAPDKAPDSYRISWKIGKKWRSIRKPNTEKAGNLIVPGDLTPIGKDCYDIGCFTYLRVRLPDGFTPPKGSTFCVRVRAIYKGEKNGPWNSHCFRQFGIFPKS